MNHKDSGLNFYEYNFDRLKSDSSSVPDLFSGLDAGDLKLLESAGMPQSCSSSGRYLQCGDVSEISSPDVDGVELLTVMEAIEKYPEVRREYLFKAVNPLKNRFTRGVNEVSPRGYFIRVKKGVKVKAPLHAGFLMNEERSSMFNHNIVILEEGASLHLVTGCVSGCGIERGVHASVTEFYVGPGAELINTGIHDWGPGFVVIPVTGAVIDRDGSYTANFYSVKIPERMEIEPVIHLMGRGASTRQVTVTVGTPGTFCKTGGTVMLYGDESSAELISKTASFGGTSVQSGLLVGAGKNCRGHVDCSGLILGETGIIKAVPGLKTIHPDARMSHEASIGRINQGEVNYLQSKGFDETSAVDLIVRGFLDTDGIDDIAPAIKEKIRILTAQSGHSF